MTSPVPIIDVSALQSGDLTARKACARQLGQACETIGFLVLDNHGVSAETRAAMRATTKAFFDRSEAEKKRFMTENGGFRGYTPLATEALAKTLDLETAPDLYEAFTIGRPQTPDDAYHNKHRADFFAPNIWPDGDDGMKAAWIDYYNAISALAARLMRAFALDLDLPESFFDDKIDRSISNLRAINYPEQLVPPKPNQIRCGEHTDYGSLTLVYPDDAPGGLQVLAKDGKWADVPYVPDAFVMNIGDLLAEWTNDRWVSTLHRVVNPPADKASTARRLSIAFFHQPNYDALIECLPTCVTDEAPPRYDPVFSGEHLQRKVAAQAVA